MNGLREWVGWGMVVVVGGGGGGGGGGGQAWKRGQKTGIDITLQKPVTPTRKKKPHNGRKER